MSQIPENFQPALWSHNLAELELERDRVLIITRLLNYGDINAVRWVYKTYGEAAIRKVVSEPARGAWIPRVLNYWTKYLGIELTADALAKATARI